jgi:hypothetical protein
MTSLPTLVPGVNKGNPDCDGYRLKDTTRLGALFEQGDAANRVQRRPHGEPHLSRQEVEPEFGDVASLGEQAL